MRMTMEKAVTSLGLAFALALVAGPLTAQDRAEGHWLPWLGCWVEESAPEAAMLCVVPAAEGVELRTLREGEVIESRVLEADGVERPTEMAGCAGPRAVEFSPDGLRVYSRAALRCGEDAVRHTRGLMAMVYTDRWVHVRSLRMGADADDVVWVERYRPAPPERVEAAGMGGLVASLAERRGSVELARRAAAQRIRVDHVIEATAEVGSEAVRAWIAEQGQPFRLDADDLVRLADAGVSSDVIDLMVAVSYPEHFAVSQEPAIADRDDGRYDAYAYGPAGYPFFGSRYGYGLYGYRYSRFGYSPFGFGGVPSYGWYRNPTVIVVTPRDERRPTGRAVKGRGYTQGTGTSSGTAASSRPDRRPSVRATGSRGTRGAVTSRGSSRGTSKGKAKPRGSGKKKH